MSRKRVTREFANFEAKISLNNPCRDYVKLVDEKIRPDAIVPHDVHQECWKKISAAARETIWKMLFIDRRCLNKQHLQQAADLLKMLKEDSAYYRATEYNRWIVDLRDELLRRNMLDFWRNEIVKNELGPCWARDSDLFDDNNDPEPANFYKYANCEAPWLREAKRAKIATVDNAEAVISSTADSTEMPKTAVKLRKISNENAVEDYKYNMEAAVAINPVDPDYLPVFEEAREMVWNFLFTEPILSAVNYRRAAELLYEYKKDAVYHNPWDYNDWIPAVRDELLKMKFFDFWKNVMVKHELGLCWARDSDYYSDMEDPEPVNFYKFANCEAAWLKQK